MDLIKFLTDSVKKGEKDNETLRELLTHQADFYNSLRFIIIGFYLSLSTSFAVYFFTKIMELKLTNEENYLWLLVVAFCVSIIVTIFVLVKIIFNMRQVDNTINFETKKMIAQNKKDLKESRKALRMLEKSEQ